MTTRQSPIQIPPLSSAIDESQRATAIFIHGFGGQGSSFTDIAHKIQSSKKLPHVTWIFPNAPKLESMDKFGWYDISGLGPPPADGSPRQPQDRPGLLTSMEYIVSLVDEQVTQGIRPSRIVVSGFSQGSALSLLVALISKYAGKLAGIACVAGYMPIADQIGELRKQYDSPEVGNVPILLMRGKNDNVIPDEMGALAQLKMLGYERLIESNTYDIGHELSDEIITDIATWLEKVLPGS